MRALLPLTLLVVPILEIAVFIMVGGQIGIPATLGMILLTAIIGTLLLRRQGFQIIEQVRYKMDSGELPGKELANGAMILVAGVLLLTPGFVTDTIGFLLFVPGLRDTIWKGLASKVIVMGPDMARPGSGPGRGPYDDDNVVDLDASEFSEKPNPNSPWKQKISQD